MKPLYGKYRLFLFALAILVISFGCLQTAQPGDPLPSWNDVPSKKSIVEFVNKVTTEGGPDFVPPAERIAVFDNDGTLWSEQPVVQGMFLLYQLERMAKKDPSLRNRQPFRAAFEHDKEYLHTAGMPAIVELFAATHAGMSQKKFDSAVEEFFAISKHPTLDVPYGQVVFQPMIELLAYLRANGFKTYICSGGGIDFMRGVSAELYGIPPEQVIGSSFKKELQQVDGKWVLSRTGKPNSFNDKEVKPVNIDLHIGQRPLLAMGNVRSGGDIGMLSYSQGRKGLSLQLLVNHDDEKREFAYAEDDNASISAAKANGWLVVSIKNDWKRIFSFDLIESTDTIDFQKLIGKWVRPDGGYVLDIKSISPDGKIEMAYLNPRPINVSKAQANVKAGNIELFIELRDKFYPGNYYTLIYDSEKNQLVGVYHHLGLKQDFDVFFIRS